MAQDASSFLDDGTEKTPSASSFLGEESATDFLGSPSPYSEAGIAAQRQALVQSAANLRRAREESQEPQYRIGIKAPFGLSDGPLVSAPIPAELAAFGAEAAKSVIPTGAGLAAASAVTPFAQAAGMALRAAPGAGRFAAPLVEYGVPLVAGGGASILSRLGQDKGLPVILPEDAARSYELTGQLAAESPTAAMLGQFAGAGPFMRPGLPINTTGGARIAVPAIAGAIGGGIEGAQQLSEGKLDTSRLAAATLGSAFLNRETRLGQRIAPNLVLPNIGTELAPAELAGTGQMMRDAPLVPTDVIPSELDAMNQAGAITRAEQTAARASGERAVANAEAAGTQAKAQALAERMAGKTPQEQLSILDQEMQLQKDTLTEAEQRAGLDMKILLKQQIDQQKALEKVAADQQRAQADAQKATAEANQAPKSEQILNEAAKPPAIANVAAEIGTQTSPFALQGKLNELTAAPTPVAESAALTPKVAESAAPKTPAPATFIGVQEGIPGKIADIELYNLTQDIPGHPEGSTVSRETLEKAGFEVPQKPEAKASAEAPPGPPAKIPTTLREENVAFGEQNIPFGETASVDIESGTSAKVMQALSAAGYPVSDRLKMVYGEKPFPSKEKFLKDVELSYILDGEELLRKVRKEIRNPGGDPSKANIPNPEDFATPAEFYNAASEAESKMRNTGMSLASALVETKQMKKPIEAKAPPSPPPATQELRLNNADLELKPLSQMTRAEKRAELDAAGVKTYNGKPIDDANPAEISNAVGKLRRGQLERGAINTTVAGGVAGSGAGAVGGFVLTDREPGESDEEFQARRLRNAAIGAGIGAAGGAGIGALQRGAQAATSKKAEVANGKRVALPETEAGEGIRQTASKVIENRQYPERLRATLANDPDIVYDKFALSDLADRVSGASIQELTDMRGSPNIRERLGATAELANRYSLSPDPVLQERGAALYSELAQSLTSPAQMLGLGKLVKTPQGYVAAINETLKNVGRTLSKPQADALNKLAVESIRTEQELARATRLAEEDFSEANEAAYRNAQKANGSAKKNLDDFVHQVAPEGWDDLISKVIQGNLLTPLSLVANVFGNAVYQPVRRASSALASAMDEIYSAVRGKPRVTSRLNPLPGIGELKAAGEGIKVAAKELLTGPGVDSYVKSEVQRGFRPLRSITQAFTGENLAVQPDGTVALNDRAKKLFEGLAGAAPEAMFRVLNLGDKPFRRAAEAEILLEQARLRGLKGRDLTKFLEFPDESTQELLNTEGRRAIMAQENKGVTKLNQFLDSGMAEMLHLDQIPVAKGALKVFGRIIVPFRQFPVNYVLTALNFAAPELAFSKAIYHGSKGNRRKALQNIGEGALGVMMYGGANYLWDKGLISEPTDKDAKSRTTQYEQMGPQRINVSGLNRALEGGDPSYKLGDLTMDWGRLGIPASVFYVFTKDASQGRKETARTGENHKSSYNPASLVGDRLAAYPGMASFSLDQSWLSGTASFLEALRNPDPEGQEMQNWAANAFRAASSVAVPNSVEALAKAHYQYIPELKGDNLTETLKNTWNFKVMQLPEGDKAILKRDLWGQPISRTQPGENPYINQFVDVTRAERKQADPFKQSLIKLYQQTESPDVYPALPTRVLSEMGITAKLDPQDYEDLQEFTGIARRQFAETVMANPKMNDPSVLPELKILALQEAYAEGAKLGKARFLQNPGILQKYFPELTGSQPATEGSRTVARDPQARARLRLLTPVAEPLPTR